MKPQKARNSKMEIEAVSLDQEICRLLIDRFDHAFELAKIKKSLGEGIRDRRREAEVLARVAAAECMFLTKERRRFVYKEILAAARKMEGWAMNANEPMDCSTTSREELAQAKRQHREGIDTLDSEIVRLLDQRIALAGAAEEFETSFSHSDKNRQRICDLSANSDIKQWIWQIFSCAFGRPKTTVARPVRIADQEE